jgi:hypothetical protein
MRVRVREVPPDKSDIERIIKDGALPKDLRKWPRLLERLCQSCYLNEHHHALGPRDRLLAQYRNDGLALFLGAGVSKCSGIPNWQDLAKKMLTHIGIASDYQVKIAFPSLHTQFDLAGYTLGRKEFARRLYESLYEGLECKVLLEEIPKRREAQPGWPKWNRVLAELRRNETLTAVGELLIIEEGDNFRRNPQIHAVLTVNADNLLELYCRARTGGKRRLLTMVDRASVGDHPYAIPVSHLHGCLDARGENFLKSAPVSFEGSGVEPQEMDQELLPDLVFRESEYYETISAPASFTNHTPQSYLRRLNVLFVGTSLDDLNIRRWLYGSFRERVSHRTKYLREYHHAVYKDAEFEAKLESVRHFWLRVKEECDERLRVPVESIMSGLGVQVVWCDDYKDVRECIYWLKQSGREPSFGRRPGLRCD